MKSIKFRNGSIEMAANLFLPEGFSESKKYPAIAVAHPGGGVKEQTAGLYASKLAEEGFVTLAFDASYQGESSGEPRQLENPSTRVEDISAAIDYLTTLPYVDRDSIGVLGICAGGGYAVQCHHERPPHQGLGNRERVQLRSGPAARLVWHRQSGPGIPVARHGCEGTHG